MTIMGCAEGRTITPTTENRILLSAVVHAGEEPLRDFVLNAAR